MSWQVVDAVLSATFPDMPPGPGRRYGVGHHALQLTAVAVAYQANQDGGGARPGLRRLAARTSSSIDSVKNALHALVELRVLHLTAASNGRQPDEYRVDLTVLAAGICPADARGPARTQKPGVARGPPVHNAQTSPAR